jgi:hypothetical protein
VHRSVPQKRNAAVCAWTPWGKASGSRSIQLQATPVPEPSSFGSDFHPTAMMFILMAQVMPTFNALLHHTDIFCFRRGALSDHVTQTMRARGLHVDPASTVFFNHFSSFRPYGPQFGQEASGIGSSADKGSLV